MPGPEDRVRAHRWLDEHYPCDPAEYDPELAVDLLALRAEGYTGADVLAWVMPSRRHAEVYARATRNVWGRPAWVAVDADGLVVQVTGLLDNPWQG